MHSAHAETFRKHLGPSPYDEDRSLYGKQFYEQACEAEKAARKGTLLDALGIKEDPATKTPSALEIDPAGTFMTCGWVYVPAESVSPELTSMWLGYGERSLHAFKKPASRTRGSRAPGWLDCKKRKAAQREYQAALGKALVWRDEKKPVWGKNIDNEEVGPSYPLFTIIHEEGERFIAVPSHFWYRWHGPVDSVDPSCAYGKPMSIGRPRMNITLRKEQEEARDSVLRYWEEHAGGGGMNVTLTLPPGAGKTYTSIAICCAVAEKTLFVADKTEILAQIEDSVLDAVHDINVLLLAGDTGRILEGKWEREIDEADVLVVGKSTLAYMFKNYGDEATQKALHLHDVGTLVCDEAHHCVAEGWVSILQCLPVARGLFLTATPVRGSDGGNMTTALEHVTGPIVCRGEPHEGNLSVAAFERIGGEVVPDALSEGADGKMDVDYNKLLNQLATDPGRNEMGVSFAVEALRQDRTTVLFCNRASMQIPVLVEMLLDKMKEEEMSVRDVWRHPAPSATGVGTEPGPVVACMYSDAHKDKDKLDSLTKSWGEEGGAQNFVWVMKKPKRTSENYKLWLHQRALLKRARIVVVTLSMLKEGYDAPWLDLLILLGAVKDKDVMEQVGGRGTRPWDGYNTFAWDAELGKWLRTLWRGKRTPLMVDIVDRMEGTQIMLNMHRARKSGLYTPRRYPYRNWKESAEYADEKGRWALLFRAWCEWCEEAKEEMGVGKKRKRGGKGRGSKKRKHAGSGGGGDEKPAFLGSDMALCLENF